MEKTKKTPERERSVKKELLTSIKTVNTERFWKNLLLEGAIIGIAILSFLLFAMALMIFNTKLTDIAPLEKDVYLAATQSLSEDNPTILTPVEGELAQIKSIITGFIIKSAAVYLLIILAYSAAASLIRHKLLKDNIPAKTPPTRLSFFALTACGMLIATAAPLITLLLMKNASGILISAAQVPIWLWLLFTIQVSAYSSEKKGVRKRMAAAFKRLSDIRTAIWTALSLLSILLAYLLVFAAFMTSTWLIVPVLVFVLMIKTSNKQIIFTMISSEYLHSGAKK